MEHAHRQAARGVSACEKHTLDVHDRGPVLGAGGTGICDHIPQWGCGARLPRQLRAVHMRRLGGVSPRVAFGIPRCCGGHGRHLDMAKMEQWNSRVLGPSRVLRRRGVAQELGRDLFFIRPGNAARISVWFVRKHPRMHDDTARYTELSVLDYTRRYAYKRSTSCH